MLNAKAKKIPEWILTGKEEKTLSSEEKKEYFERLKKYCLNRKLVTTTKGATTIAPKLKKITGKIAIKLCGILSDGGEIVCDGVENVPDGSVIFAATHQGILDNFVWIPSCPKHTILFHGIVKNKALLLAQTNTGMVLVSKNKADVNNRICAKLDTMTLLMKNHSVIIWPETTWNLSPNKLHLPINYGFLDIAQKTEKPIVPLVMEYTYDFQNGKQVISKIHVVYGKPIYVRINDSINLKLKEYEESISTIFWKLIEEKGHYTRNEISNEEYIHIMNRNLDGLKITGEDIEVERRGIYGANDEFYKFHHINDVSWDAWGVLRQTEEVERLKQIDRIHGI